MAKAKKLRLFFWFQEDVKSVVSHYKKIFKSDFELIHKHPGSERKAPPSSYEFSILGNHLVAFGGGTTKFNQAISLMIVCKDQKEIDKYWSKLVEGGKPGQCGWLTDKFGVSWQIVPNNLPKLLSHKDPETNAEISKAFMSMTKIEIKDLKLSPRNKTSENKADKKSSDKLAKTS